MAGKVPGEALRVPAVTVNQYQFAPMADGLSARLWFGEMIDGQLTWHVGVAMPIKVVGMLAATRAQAEMIAGDHAIQ